MADSVMGTGNVWPYYSKTNIDKSEARNTDGTLGKDDFLKILITQLQHQDPTKPLEDREFIAQMAQFSSVEQIMNMSNEMGMLRQAIGITPDLIGKSVIWETPSLDGESVVEQTGIVSAITFKDGQQYAIVNETEVSLPQIVKIWQAEEEADPA